MRTIKLDGSTLCTMQMEPNGQMNLYFQPNSKKLKPGEISEIPVSELETDECSYKIEITKRETFVAFIKAALSFVDRSEFVNIIKNPSTYSCWKVPERKSKTKKGEANYEEKSTS